MTFLTRTRFKTALLGSVAILCTSLPTQLLAQQATDETNEEIVVDPLLIEAERQETATSPVKGYVAGQSATATKTDTPIAETPQSISVIGTTEIEARQAQSVSETLNYTAGIQPDKFGYDKRLDWFNIRGFDETQNGLYRDGLQQRSYSFVSWQQETYGLERIELMRGPTSVLYGQNAPGGLINTVSKRPRADMENEIELQTGSHNRKQGSFDIGGKIVEDGSVLFRATGLLRDSDTQVNYVEDDRVYFAPSLTWEGEDTSLTLLSYYQEDNTGGANSWLPANGTFRDAINGAIPTDFFTGEPGYDHYDRTQYAIGYEFSHNFTDSLMFRQNARYSYVEVDYDSLYGNGWADEAAGTLNRGVQETDQEGDSFAIDNQLQAKFETSGIRHTMLGGLDYQRYVFDRFLRYGTIDSINVYNPSYGSRPTSYSTPTDEKLTAEQVGVYLQDQIEFDEHWVLTLGGRHDWADESTLNQQNGTESSRNDSAFTGRTGLAYKTDFGLTPYVSYSESFNPVSGSDRFGNSFDPEEGVQYEVGAKYEPEGFDGLFTVALFDITRENVLTNDPSGGAFDNIQEGEQQSRGLEIEGLFEPIEGLTTKFAYTYQDVEITETNTASEKGNTPSGIPEHTASAWADYTLNSGPLSGLGVNGGIRYLGSTFATDANNVKVPSTTLLDAGIHYDLDAYRFALNATNLTDERYVTSCADSTNSCYYGQGRTILASVKYRW
ncbi:TonB-dependent siderophore receptor [Thalassospira lucentensis]|uniref:TonB-dependent siderophore receptor n=1 Tax=Thalassospira lucentensis TaxID=168935 RepID=UPI002943BC41|nr:TonB-dependent siderophore receptor [Thalassospira lucentensis]WOI13025.1 TonB-dependent siderophore receptor [Thalassospira lucentensis]